MNNTPTPRTDENLNMITPNQRLQNGNQIFVAKMEILMDERTREIRKASGELIQEIKSLKAQLTAVTEQRDRLAEAIRKYTSGNYPESFLSKTLQSLNPK